MNTGSNSVHRGDNKIYWFWNYCVQLPAMFLLCPCVYLRITDYCASNTLVLRERHCTYSRLQQAINRGRSFVGVSLWIVGFSRRHNFIVGDETKSNTSGFGGSTGLSLIRNTDSTKAQEHKRKTKLSGDQQQQRIISESRKTCFNAHINLISPNSQFYRVFHSSRAAAVCWFRFMSLQKCNKFKSWYTSRPYVGPLQVKFTCMSVKAKAHGHGAGGSMSHWPLLLHIYSSKVRVHSYSISICRTDMVYVTRSVLYLLYQTNTF